MKTGQIPQFWGEVSTDGTGELAEGGGKDGLRAGPDQEEQGFTHGPFRWMSRDKSRPLGSGQQRLR